MCTVFLDWILRTLCRNALCYKLSWFPFLFCCVSLIQSFILKLWQTQLYGITMAGVTDQPLELTSYPEIAFASHYATSLQTQFIYMGWLLSRWNHALHFHCLWCALSMSPLWPQDGLWCYKIISLVAILLQDYFTHALFPAHTHGGVPQHLPLRKQDLVMSD